VDSEAHSPIARANGASLYGFLAPGFRGPRDFGLGGFGFFAPGLISVDNGFFLLIGILPRDQTALLATRVTRRFYAFAPSDATTITAAALGFHGQRASLHRHIACISCRSRLPIRLRCKMGIPSNHLCQWRCP
jgi:hypothetical protein